MIVKTMKDGFIVIQNRKTNKWYYRGIEDGELKISVSFKTKEEAQNSLENRTHPIMKTSELTNSQKKLLNSLVIGKESFVATSQFWDAEYVKTGRVAPFKPDAWATAIVINNLIKKGYLTGMTYWRGATVTRIK